MPSHIMTSLQSFYCKPGVSKKFKGKVGMIAVKNIDPNTRVMDLPLYNGQWVYTKDLEEKYVVDYSTIQGLQELYQNKKLFMQNSNRKYTFIPTIPIREYHGAMFMNQSQACSNVTLRSNGYYTTKKIACGEELLLIHGDELLIK